MYFLKKIVAITKVKNESDIIESLCRYTVEYCDAILIYENDSIDNTREIIQKLIDEGLPIYFVDDIKEGVKKGKIKKLKIAMTQRAFDEFGADILLHFDADEFLSSTDSRNPRELLESLDETVEYRVKWRGYVYQGEPDNAEMFLPDRFEYYRNPKLDWQTKAIMSRYLYEVKQAKPGIANHFLTYPRETFDAGSTQKDTIDHYYRWEVRNKTVKMEVHENLVFAHYAIRSKAQLMSKAIPNWILQLTTADREGVAFPWKKIFDYIKQHGEISRNGVREHSLEYAVFPFEEASRVISELDGDILIHGPLPTGFCRGNLKLKYTDYTDTGKTWIKTTLTEFEDALTKLPEREAEAVYLMRETRRHNNGLQRLLDSKEEEINRQENVIRQRGEEIKQQEDLIKQQR
jgi:hypothetical protein